MFYVVPDETSRVAHSVSVQMSRYTKPIGNVLLQWAVLCAKDNTMPAIDLAKQLADDKQFNSTTDVLKRAIERTNEPRNRELLQERLNQIKSQIQDS